MKKLVVIVSVLLAGTAFAELSTGWNQAVPLHEQEHQSSLPRQFTLDLGRMGKARTLGYARPSPSPSGHPRDYQSEGIKPDHRGTAAEAALSSPGWEAHGKPIGQFRYPYFAFSPQDPGRLLRWQHRRGLALTCFGFFVRACRLESAKRSMRPRTSPSQAEDRRSIKGA